MRESSQLLEGEARIRVISSLGGGSAPAAGCKIWVRLLEVVVFRVTRDQVTLADGLKRSVVNVGATPSHHRASFVFCFIIFYFFVSSFNRTSEIFIKFLFTTGAVT